MSTFTKVNSFVKACAEKVHNLGSDQLVVALCNAANAPTAATTNLASLTTIDHTNLSSRNVTTISSEQASGTYKLVCADLTLTAAGAVPTFRYAVLYNDTAAGKEVIGFYDKGLDITLSESGEQVVIDFDASNGVLTIA